MKENFFISMGKSDCSYDPLRFLSSDYFQKYWTVFIPDVLNDTNIQLVQEAARRAVDDFMYWETIYWNTSFDRKKSTRIWLNFAKSIDVLSEEKKEAVYDLCLQFVISKIDKKSIDYTLELITSLCFDELFYKSVEYLDTDKAILNATYEYNVDKWIDNTTWWELEEEFLTSTSLWDIKLREQTPDLPESISVIFSSAYETRTVLPTIKRNLKLILTDNNSYNEFVARLKDVFQRSLSGTTGITFPDNIFHSYV